MKFLVLIWFVTGVMSYYCENGCCEVSFELPRSRRFRTLLPGLGFGFLLAESPCLTLPFETSSRGIFDQGDARVQVLCRGEKSKSSGFGVKVTACERVFSSFERRRPTSGRRLIVWKLHEPHRTSTSGVMGERRLRTKLSACAPKASSIRWFRRGWGPICRWPKPWRRWERGIRWRVARGRRPSI